MQEDKLGKTKMKTKLKEFTALVPMGGRFEGRIALHSTMAYSLESAIEWAKVRFSRMFVVVQDDDYPELYDSELFPKSEEEDTLDHPSIKMVRDIYESFEPIKPRHYVE